MEISRLLQKVALLSALLVTCITLIAQPVSAIDGLYDSTEWYTGTLAGGACTSSGSTTPTGPVTSGTPLSGFKALPFVVSYMKDKAKNISDSMPRYQKISAATGMPWQLIASFHLREGGANPKAAILDGRIPPYTNPDWHKYFPTVDSVDQATIGYIRTHFAGQYPEVYANGKSGTIKANLSLKDIQNMGASWKTGGWWKNSGHSLNDFPYDMNYWDAAHADMVWQSWMAGDVGPGKISAGTHDGNPGLVTDYAYLVESGGGTISGGLDTAASCGGATTTPDPSTFIYYNQNDVKWAKDPFNGSNIKSSGCGATSYAMAVANLNQDPSVNPGTIAAWSQGFTLNYVGESLAEHGQSKYGIQYKLLHTDMAAIVAALKAGHWVIISGAAGHAPYYTGAGHIVLAHGITADNKLIVADPERGAADQYDVPTINSGLKYAVEVWK